MGHGRHGANLGRPQIEGMRGGPIHHPGRPLRGAAHPGMVFGPAHLLFLFFPFSFLFLHFHNLIF
jgi:hypothetical protein